MREELKHDGTSIEWPELSAPECYAGIHIQEIIDLCLRRGLALCPIELNPRKAPQGHHNKWTLVYSYDETEARFRGAIANRPGLLYGQTKDGKNHTCAWDGVNVYDPNGKVYGLEHFRIKECWILCSLNHCRLCGTQLPYPGICRFCEEDRALRP